jgi:RimJ/RimL family protein N-acetyltransferase
MAEDEMTGDEVEVTARPKDLPSAVPDLSVPPPARPSVDRSRLEFAQVVPEDLATLVAWLTTDTWPFHGRPRPTAEQVHQAAAAGNFWGDEHRAFWVILDEASRVGLVRIEYLSDTSPTTDFRIRTPYRGRGIGTQLVRWAADHLFSTFPEKLRLEGQTRADNLGMQRAFRRAGWVAEAYYRQAWPCEDGPVFDAIGYAIVRDDWANGTITPIPWPLE